MPINAIIAAQSGATAPATVAGMVVGILFTFCYIVFFKFVSPELNTPEYWLFGISPEGIGTLGMIINFVVATIVHKATGDAPEDIQELVESIRYPKGSGEAQSH